MRVLLDEMMSSKLARELVGHEVSTVQREGWASLANGRLLDAIDSLFDVFITMDKGMRHQQHVTGRPFGIIEVRARSNAIRALQPAALRILAAIDTIQPGEIMTVGVVDGAGDPDAALA
jgi:predicted nuclease of predicted toxin-antitoxin system